MSRLSERAKTEEKLQESLIRKTDEDIRINIVMRKSLLNWLDQAIATHNNTHPRHTNRSEVFRLLVHRLREDGLGAIL